MASTRVVTKKTTLRTEAIKKVASNNPEVLKKLEDQYRKFTGKQVKNIVTDHFQEAIHQAAHLVGQGLPGAESGTARTVNTRFGEVLLDYWQALTSRHRAMKQRKFPGTQGIFWKMSGATGRYLLKVAVGVKSASLSKVKAEPSSATAKATVRISSTITTPSTGDAVIDSIMRDAFVQGRPTLPTRGQGEDGGALSQAGIIAVMEAGKRGQPARPLISQLAAALGIRARQAIGKIKQ